MYLRHDNGILEIHSYDRMLYDSVFIFSQKTGGEKTESLGLPNVGFSCYRNCVLQVRTRRKKSNVETDLIRFVPLRYL